MLLPAVLLLRVVLLQGILLLVLLPGFLRVALFRVVLLWAVPLQILRGIDSLVCAGVVLLFLVVGLVDPGLLLGILLRHLRSFDDPKLGR